MKNIKRIIAALSLLLSAGTLAAQETVSEANYYNMDLVRSKSGWLTSSNAAGLEANPADISVVEGFWSYEKGGLRDVWDGTKNNFFGVYTESYKKLRKLSLYGKLGFDYLFENDKAWSSMAYPGSTPMHISDNIPGQHRRERYTVAAGVSIPVSDRVSLGISGRYNTLSALKRRDVRSQSIFSSLSVSPGVMIKTDPVNIGLSLTYSYEGETIELGREGSMASLPFVNIFQGLWFGNPESYSTNVHKARRFDTNIYGAALQAEFNITPCIKFFNEVSVNYLKQEQGLKGDGVDNKFGSYDKLGYTYNGLVSFKGSRIDHYVRLNANFFDLNLYSDIMSLQPVEGMGGATELVYFGKVRSYYESFMELGAEYSFYKKRNEWNNSLILKAGANYLDWDKTFTAYPAKWMQNIKSTYLYVSATPNFLTKRGMIDVTVEVGYRTGSGTPNEKDSGEGMEVDLKGIVQNTDLLEWNFAYMTCNRLSGYGAVRYTHFLNTAKGTSVYAEANLNLAKAFKDPVLGKTRRGVIGINVGMKF